MQSILQLASSNCAKVTQILAIPAFTETRYIKKTKRRIHAILGYSIFEPTCANARWALMSRFLSVHLWLDQNYWTIIHISRTVWGRVTKFGMAMNIDVIFIYFAYFIWVSRSKVTWAKVKGHIDQVQKRVPKKGRWAHINIKLLHSRIFLSPRI